MKIRFFIKQIFIYFWNNSKQIDSIILEKQRIISIDIFRGLTMILMTIVNNPGSWEHIYAPLEHAEWHGCTPTDLVFPFFIFAMGLAIPFSSTENSGLDKPLFLRIFTRSLRIICIGLFLNFFSKVNIHGIEGIPLMLIRVILSVLVGWALLGNFPPKTKLWLVLGIFFTLMGFAYSGMENFLNMRIPGVLQRIGTVYFLAMLLFLNFRMLTQLVIGAVILLAYWGFMALIPISGFGAPNFNQGTNLAAWLDNFLLPGHLYIKAKTWDPEGVLSTFPAIVTALLGIWTGSNIKKDSDRTNKYILVIGICLVVLGKVWDLAFPINKALWTSSYVVYTAGIAMILLTLIQSIFSSSSVNSIARFFIMWGVNPMIVFYGSGIIPRALNMIKISNNSSETPLLAYFYQTAIEPLFSNPLNSSLCYALLYVSFWSIVLYALNSRKLIFKV
jgi:predicted acyltransferase